MKKYEFRSFLLTNITPRPISSEFNLLLSDTDPSFAMPVGEFIRRSSLGLSVPQSGEIRVEYNNLKANEVSDIDSIKFDKFDAAIQARRSQKQLNNQTKKIFKDYESKENQSK